MAADLLDLHAKLELRRDKIRETLFEYLAFKGVDDT